MTYAQWYRSGNENSRFGISPCVSHTQKLITPTFPILTDKILFSIVSRPQRPFHVAASCLEPPMARREPGGLNIAILKQEMLCRQTNDCRTRDYSHEKVNKVGSQCVHLSVKSYNFGFPSFCRWSLQLERREQMMRF